MTSDKDNHLILELCATLREWHKIWKSLYLDNQTDLLHRIGDLIEELVDLKVELTNLLEEASAQTDEIKVDIAHKLDLGNKLLNLDLMPRDANFKLVDPIICSPLKLYRIHSDAANSLTSSSPTNIELHGYLDNVSSISSLSEANSGSSLQGSYHLQMALRNHNLSCIPPDEQVEVQFLALEATSAANTQLTGATVGHLQSVQLKPLTDKFQVNFVNDKIIGGTSNTIFSNLGSPIGRTICILIQVYRIGRMTISDGHKMAFAKHQSLNNNSLNGPTNCQEGSNNSLTSATKYVPNGLSRSQRSTVSLSDNFPSYKRPFGAAILNLKDYPKISQFKENTVTVRIQQASNEQEFSNFQDLYLKKNSSVKSNQASFGIQLDLSVKMIACRHDKLTKLFPHDTYFITEKRDFTDIVMPGDFKNDLYFTIESAEFEKGKKSIPKNIEATISLINKNGLVIDGCISPASNCENISSYKSCVFYHSNSPRWMDSIKINVPLAGFDSYHIRIEFRHCSTKEKDRKFLGFAFLPLSDEVGAVIPDDLHDLFIYKCDPQFYADNPTNLCIYSTLPYGPNAKFPAGYKTSTASQNFSHGAREIVTVSTFLISTKLTQNTHLLNLLKWRESIKKNPKEFEEALRKILTLQGEEIVKFLQDILDTLFDTFTLYSSTEDDHSALIFKVLIHVFLLLDEPKFQHFRPVVDTYATSHFSATLVHKGLLACVKKCIEYSSMVERHVPIQKCFKSMRYIFQFIVQSKLLYSKASGAKTNNDEQFLNDLRHLFKLFEVLLATDNKKLVPVQATFLESFPACLEHLMKVVSSKELASVVASLVGSVGVCIPTHLARAKLVFMRETASSELLRIQEVRMQITINFCRHIDFFVKHSKEVDLCFEVLDILVVKVHDYHWPSIYRLYQLTIKSRPVSCRIEQSSDPTDNRQHVMTVGEINSLTQVSQIQANQLDMAMTGLSQELTPFVNLMDPLLHLLDHLMRDFNTDRILVQKYCTTLLTILKLMGRLSFEQFAEKRKMDFLKLCNLFRSFRAVYNRDWFLMQLTSHSILEHPINEISKDVRVKLLESQPSSGYAANHRQLSSYVKLIVDFITHPTLQLEVFSDRKKSYVLEVFGDLRLKFGEQLMRFWSDLKLANICDITPTLIQYLLDASLLPNQELQRKLIPVFWDMLDAEEQFKAQSRQIERCLIDSLDLFLNLDKGNSIFADNFERIMMRLISERLPSWESRGSRLVGSLTRLMRLLMRYRQSLEPTESRNKRMSLLVDLLTFYKDLDRTDLRLKYLFRLCDMHLEAANYVEAALTLKLYADELQWCQRTLVPLEGYRPEEPESRRKELVYLNAIDYFDMAKCWEEAIPLCKELASFYETYHIDYERVSLTLKRLASLLDKILHEHRPEREYFRVEFLGADLGDFVRNKELVFRGGEYERLAAFMQRMTTEFPDAQILNPKSRLSVGRSDPGQFMVISNVKPVPSLQEHLKNAGQRNINDRIIHYYLNNRLDLFSYDTPVIKDPSGQNSSSSGPELNVKHLWVNRSVLRLDRQLPDILPWSEVVSKEHLEISPVNHAIETISNMNLELSKLILSYRNEPTKQVSPLTMRLQGVIEASVNGGPVVIVNAFLKADDSTGPIASGDREPLLKLRGLIEQQFSLLEAGLALHSKLVPPEVMPLHSRLVERLQTIRDLLYDDDQLLENNYEVLQTNNNNSNTTTNNNNNINVVDGSQPITKIVQTDLGMIEGSGRTSATDSLTERMELANIRSVTSDEVDGMSAIELSGDSGDQIYSQPIEPSLGSRISNVGTKSEFSSPSRGTYPGSSSLSAVALLSNLPVNRSRLSPQTPNKDPANYQAKVNGQHHSHSLQQNNPNMHGGHHSQSQNTTPKTSNNLIGNNLGHLSANELCARAARTLTYGTSSSSSPNSSVRDTLKSLHKANPEEAPPLPPRSYPTSVNGSAPGNNLDPVCSSAKLVQPQAQKTLRQINNKGSSSSVAHPLQPNFGHL